MNTYMITPKHTLGSDSFYVAAKDKDEAIAIAKRRIKLEDWHSPDGWEIMQELGTFEDDAQ